MEPALNGILALDMVLGLREIMIVHHTDCNAATFTDDQVRAHYITQGAAPQAVVGMEFGAFTE